MLIGRSLFGGGALILATKFGIHSAIGLMIVSILLTMVLLLFIHEPKIIVAGRNRFKDFKNNFSETFSSKRTWYAIAFALTGAAAFEAAGSMAGPFLTDHNIGAESIGYFFGVVVVAAMLIGSLAGGYFSDKISRELSVTLFLSGIIIAVSAIALAGFIGGEMQGYSWIILFTIMYLFTGMFTASSYAYFMDITNPRLGATEFSTFMAATNGCEAWVVWSAGYIAASSSYSHAFLTMCAVSIFSLIFLQLNRRNHSAGLNKAE
jgi:predicted MFS family arabinose efflux permease